MTHRCKGAAWLQFVSLHYRHLMTMPPAVFLEKVAALRKGMASEEGEVAVPHSMSFRRPAGRYADRIPIVTRTHL